MMAISGDAIRTGMEIPRLRALALEGFTWEFVWFGLTLRGQNRKKSWKPQVDLLRVSHS